MMRAVIFLDFDDVLAVHREHNSSQVLAAFKQSTLDDIPELWDHVFHHSARTNLRSLHDEFTPLYVISSSWTLHFDREQICEVLRRTGLSFVVDHLHRDWCTPRHGGSYRLTEIEGWLDMHSPDTPLPCLVLDDELSGQSIRGSLLEKHAVLCDASVGFTYPKLRLSSHAKFIVNLLPKPLIKD
jgi:hypothetical protein